MASQATCEALEVSKEVLHGNRDPPVASTDNEQPEAKPQEEASNASESEGASKGKGKKDAKKRRDGDWFCPACGQYQFSYRTACRQCDVPKPDIAQNMDLR